MQLHPRPRVVVAMRSRRGFAWIVVWLGGCGAANGGTGSSGPGETEAETEAETASDGSGSDDQGDSDDTADATDDTADDDATDTNDTSDTDDTGEPTCDATHHAAEPTAWTLPMPTTTLQGEPFTRMAGERSCDDGTTDYFYTTMDLDGDGTLDLVVTSACDDDGVGTDGWFFYAGAAGGFAEEPSLWSLPVPPTTPQGEPFRRVGGENSCADGTSGFRYTTADLTGDGIVDLVLTSACDDAVGDSAWLVYAGGRDGFADTPSAWSLPTPPATLDAPPFTRFAGEHSCNDGTTDFFYTTFDLRGDGIPDLVVTSACDDEGVGTDGWLVYEGTGDGFAERASLWSLPTPIVDGDSEPFRRLSGENSCSDGTTDFFYTTTDLTGDGVVDLVVTSACDRGDTGTTAWLVYPGGASGFADDPFAWSLPEPTVTLDSEPFRRLAGENSCNDGTTDFFYTTTDLTGDRVPDLVVTSACDVGDVGTEGWLFYPGGDDGFAAEPSLWTLPEALVPLTNEPFTRMAGERSCSDGTTGFIYTTAEITGDGLVDLVLTNACDGGEVGTTAWLVYPGACG